MKNKVLLFSLFFVFVSARSQVQYGMKAGVNYVNNIMVNLPYKGGNNNKFRLGYHIGGLGQIKLKQKLILCPEILFSNKGYKFEGLPNTQPSGGGGVHLNYINLPLLLGYKVIDDWTIVLGPELGYLVSAKSKFKSETIDVKYIWDNNFDFGLLIGSNYALSNKFTIEIRYIHGLSSVISGILLMDENGELTNNKLKYQNRTFQVSVSYRLK